MSRGHNNDKRSPERRNQPNRLARPVMSAGLTEKPPVRAIPTATNPAPRTALNSTKPKSQASRRISNGLVALSSAAIISVYGIGYAQTQAAENTINQLQGQASLPNLASPTAVAPPATLTPFVVDQPQAISSVVSTLAPIATATTVRQPATPTPLPASTNPLIAKILQATVVPTPIPTATVASASKYKDGSYTGMGYSRHGNIEATVVVQAGKIVSADVTMCGTRYRCSYVLDLVDEVISTQAPPVDLVSGATDSSDAYTGAVQQALSKAG